jgi:hypothetical protein
MRGRGPAGGGTARPTLATGTGGYLSRIADPVRAGEQVASPKLKPWGWPAEVSIPQEQVSVSRPRELAERVDMRDPRRSAERFEVNQHERAGSGPAREEPQRGKGKTTQGPRTAMVAEVIARVPGEAKAGIAESREAAPGQVAELIPNTITKTMPGSTQGQTLQRVQAQSRIAEPVRGERNPATAEPARSEASKRAIPKRAQERSDANLNSVVVKHASETTTAFETQSRDAKQSGEGEWTRNTRQEAKREGVRVSIGSIEVRAVVRQAAPQVVAAPAAPSQAASRTHAAAVGPLTRGLGWGFGLVQG